MQQRAQLRFLDPRLERQQRLELRVAILLYDIEDVVLGEEFLDLCDSLNLDAVMEPVKPGV